MTEKFEIQVDGDSLTNVEIEGFDANKLAEDLNDTKRNMIAIGELVVQRHEVTRVVPMSNLEDE